jgi:copper ion binding protein
MITETFKVPGMSCHHCINAISEEVTSLSGVQKVQATLDDKIVAVEHGDQVSTDAIIAAINEAGYDEVTKVN